MLNSYAHEQFFVKWQYYSQKNSDNVKSESKSRLINETIFFYEGQKVLQKSVKSSLDSDSEKSAQ